MWTDLDKEKIEMTVIYPIPACSKGNHVEKTLKADHQRMSKICSPDLSKSGLDLSRSGWNLYLTVQICRKIFRILLVVHMFYSFCIFRLKNVVNAKILLHVAVQSSIQAIQGNRSYVCVLCS